MSIEFQFLLACLGSYLSEQGEANASGMLKKVDWKKFLAHVYHHKVSYFVLRAAKRHPQLGVPEEIIEQLRKHHNRARQNMLRLAAELVRLSQLFRANNIPFISLKGPLTALRLSNDIGARESKDIDILVSPENMDRAHELLSRESYQRLVPAANATGRQLRHTKPWRKDYLYQHFKKKICIELHWKLMCGPNFPSLDTADVWDESSEVILFGEKLRQLTPSLEFKYLCAHGLQTHFHRLIWLMDVALYCQQFPHIKDVYWTEPDIRFSIQLTKRAFERTPPTDLKAVLSLLYIETCVYFFSQNSVFRSLMTFILLPEYNWRRFRFRYQSAIYPIDLDIQKFPLPDHLFWLYYPLRPFLWLWRKSSSTSTTEPTGTLPS